MKKLRRTTRPTALSMFTLLTMAAIGGAALAQQTPSTKAKTATEKAQSAVREWAEEPDSFMGIKFGQSLIDQIPECPKDALAEKLGLPAHIDIQRVSAEKLRCVELKNSKPEHIWNAPAIGIPLGAVQPWVAGGSFEGMFLRFQHADFGKMLELLRARYGEPSKLEVRDVQNLYGAQFRGQVAIWKGKNVTLLVSEYGSRIDFGALMIYTVAFDATQDKDRKDSVEKHKSNL